MSQADATSNAPSQGMPHSQQCRVVQQSLVEIFDVLTPVVSNHLQLMRPDLSTPSSDWLQTDAASASTRQAS